MGNESAHFCASVPVGHPLAFRTALQSPEIKRMQNHAQREDFKRSVAVGLSQASCGVYVDASEPGSSIQVLGSFSSSALPVGSSYDHLITCDRHLTRTDSEPPGRGPCRPCGGSAPSAVAGGLGLGGRGREHSSSPRMPVPPHWHALAVLTSSNLTMATGGSRLRPRRLAALGSRSPQARSWHSNVPRPGAC